MGFSGSAGAGPSLRCSSTKACWRRPRRRLHPERETFDVELPGRLRRAFAALFECGIASDTRRLVGGADRSSSAREALDGRDAGASGGCSRDRLWAHRGAGADARSLDVAESTRSTSRWPVPRRLRGYERLDARPRRRRVRRTPDQARAEAGPSRPCASSVRGCSDSAADAQEWRCALRRRAEGERAVRHGQRGEAALKGPRLLPAISGALGCRRLRLSSIAPFRRQEGLAQCATSCAGVSEPASATAARAKLLRPGRVRLRSGMRFGATLERLIPCARPHLRRAVR